MTRATELAREAGLPSRAWKREIEAFYTLARADYEAKLSAVMPADFKDWHEGSRNEWPELAAWVITNLREHRADLEAELDMYKATAEATVCMHCDTENEQLRKERQAFKDVAEYQKAENEKLRQMLVSFTESDYIKKQHPKRYAVARALLGETK